MNSNEARVNMPNSPLPKSAVNVLLVNASSRSQDSVTRYLTDRLIEQLEQSRGIKQLRVRDVAADPLTVIDEPWVIANFTDPAERTGEQNAVLLQSDELVNELKAADVIILGVPIYNFSVPAALKAWIDLVARAGRTFRYTSNGPVGLLNEKQAFVVVASGGVAIGSPIDFATPYMKHVLGFIGIDNVEVIAAERLNINSEASRQSAELQITQAISEFNLQQSNVA